MYIYNYLLLCCTSQNIKETYVRTSTFLSNKRTDEQTVNIVYHHSINDNSKLLLTTSKRIIVSVEQLAKHVHTYILWQRAVHMDGISHN